MINFIKSLFRKKDVECSCIKTYRTYFINKGMYESEHMHSLDILGDYEKVQDFSLFSKKHKDDLFLVHEILSMLKQKKGKIEPLTALELMTFLETCRVELELKEEERRKNKKGLTNRKKRNIL
jgi:hypothetical protein